MKNELEKAIAEIEKRGIEWTLWSIKYCGKKRYYAADCGTMKAATTSNGETAESALKSALKLYLKAEREK